MNMKDPFQPLIYIIVSFLFIYSLYCVVYKTDWLSMKTDELEYGTNSSTEEPIRHVAKRSVNRAMDIKDETSQPLLVLVLASNPRSGSTPFSEILATAKDSVLFFEPIYHYHQSTEFANGINISDYLSNILDCTYSDQFENWLKDDFSFNQYYHSSVLQCYKERDSKMCLQELDLRSICQDAGVRIAKVVRMKLSWVENLLQSPYLNMKVIHLLRDPRGSITSMQNLFWGWKPSVKCGNLWQDMQDYDRLLQKYPAKLTNVTLEELSLYPVATMKRIHLFLHGHSNLSPDTKLYLKKHMNSSKYQDDHMSTYRVSADEYQSWRWEINGRLLSEIESISSCRSVIEKFGHNLFGTLERVTDPRIPLEVIDKS